MVYTYACLKCGRIGTAKFFKKFAWRGPGFKTFIDKCEGDCSFKAKPFKCAYTRHVIIQKSNLPIMRIHYGMNR